MEGSISIQGVVGHYDRSRLISSEPNFRILGISNQKNSWLFSEWFIFTIVGIISVIYTYGLLQEYACFFTRKAIFEVFNRPKCPSIIKLMKEGIEVSWDTCLEQCARFCQASKSYISYSLSNCQCLIIIFSILWSNKFWMKVSVIVGNLWIITWHNDLTSIDNLKWRLVITATWGVTRWWAISAWRL